MATRALNLLEKLYLTRHSNFVGALEIRALVNAKYWYDFSGTASSVGLTAQQLEQLQAYAAIIHEGGHLPENVNFARTWLSIYQGAVAIPETSPPTEDWDLETPEGLQSLTEWFVSTDQISLVIDDAFKIHAFR